MTADADPGRPPDQEPPEPPATGRARLLLAGTLLALFGAMLGYKVLRAGGLEQSALFYVGLPALIALVVVSSARPRSAAGTAVAVTTIGLLLAGPLLDEGVVCLVMAAPLFYLVAVLFGLIASLAGAPDYSAPRSAFLRLVPFPRPERAEGTGLQAGDERTVRFTGGHRPTRMVLRVTEARTGPDGGRAVFTVADDTTLARWLRLDRAQAQWHATPQGGTRLAWTLHYERTFDPSWYWGPLQSYGMDRAAGYLADTFACAAAPADPAEPLSGSAARCHR
ncbi:hypothetical protein [Streptomonospora salina]|uniref:Uncharacterized protein n=1 Tax=Streptomonospora salina TaxID=104205 RepID=A0A841E5K0_9ACTN|nr:hypothetical protein [Streptomonospora salina]MBB5996468.1 hypothetical protein [Streptomonospora salina]